MSETLAASAQTILHDWIQSESLRKHCYAVADSMKHFAQLRGEDADLWEAVGLLHDMDYERYPMAVAGVGDPGGTERPVSEEPGSAIRRGGRARAPDKKHS
jgi:predicted hydrolase (HD superfamily)